MAINDGNVRSPSGEGVALPADVDFGRVKVVNIGNPLDQVISRRSLRPDFRNVDLLSAPTDRPFPHTIVADVNRVDLRTAVGNTIRFLRASNVPFVRVPSGSSVDPASFVRQARDLGARNIVVTTGRVSLSPLIQALRQGGFSMRVRQLHRRTFITARAPR
jgi:hypothetical protein